MKQKIIDVIKSLKGEVVFPELYSIPGIIGDFSMMRGKQCIWSGLSESAITALKDLMRDGKLAFYPCGDIPYIIAGYELNYPISPNTNSVYNNVHWLPVQIVLIDGRDNDPK